MHKPAYKTDMSTPQGAPKPGTTPTAPVDHKKDLNRNVISRQKLLEHGVHFGHKTDRWNPKMKPYIQGIKNETHIINLDRTINNLNRAYKALYEVTKKDGKVLFVGTKKQASNAVKLNAIRSGSFYIHHRWLGGTLTNFSTIRKSIERYKNLERLSKDNFAGYSKKEAGQMYKDLKKMELALGGIKYMRHKPSAVVLSSSVEDNIALQEAKKLGVPIFAIVDTNANPDEVTFRIPANDDANKSQALILTILADAICDAKGMPRKVSLMDESKIEVLGINPRIPRPEYPRYNKFGKKPYDKNFKGRSSFNKDGNRPPFVKKDHSKPFSANAANKPAPTHTYNKPGTTTTTTTPGAHKPTHTYNKPGTTPVVNKPVTTGPVVNKPVTTTPPVTNKPVDKKPVTTNPAAKAPTTTPVVKAPVVKPTEDKK